LDGRVLLSPGGCLHPRQHCSPLRPWHMTLRCAPFACNRRVEALESVRDS